jgi:hypothetical protein
MRQTPFQEVKKSFEGRAKLVEQLAGMVDKQHGDSTPEQVKSRLMGLSYSKLLRLWKVEQKVRERFGDREKLIAAIVDARKKAGLTADDTFKKSLENHSKARLLDLSNMNHGERPKKLTPDQKMAKKRGRKTRERAASAKAKGKG